MLLGGEVQPIIMWDYTAGHSSLSRTPGGGAFLAFTTAFLSVGIGPLYESSIANCRETLETPGSRQKKVPATLPDGFQAASAPTQGIHSVEVTPRNSKMRPKQRLERGFQNVCLMRGFVDIVSSWGNRRGRSLGAWSWCPMLGRLRSPQAANCLAVGRWGS